MVWRPRTARLLASGHGEPGGCDRLGGGRPVDGAGGARFRRGALPVVSGPPDDPALRDVYPMDLVRATIKWTLGVAFALGVLSVLLKRRKVLGLTGAGLATVATVMGGSEVAVAGPVARSSHVGLDWFLLDLFLLSAIFVPLELLFARLREQPIFRPGWRTDLWHFGVSHLLVQVTVLLTMAPAALFFRWATAPELQAAVARQPYVLQFLGVLVVADLTQYTVHRLFHEIPWFWRFHQIHHSSQHLDWLAGSRLHLVDIVVTRGLTFVPIYVLGFAARADLCVPALRVVPGGADPRQRELALRRPALPPGDAPVPPLAPQRRPGRRELRRAPAGHRCAVRHLLSARVPVADGLRDSRHPVPEGYWAQLALPFRRSSAAGVEGAETTGARWAGAPVDATSARSVEPRSGSRATFRPFSGAR